MRLLDKELDDAVVIGPKTNLAFLRALMRAPEVVERRVRHRLHRRASRSASAPAPHPPDQGAVLAGAQLLLARRDASRPSPLSPYDPWGVLDSFELVGARHVGLDVTIDGKPERLHVTSGGEHGLDAAARMASAGPARPEVTLFETAAGVYAFAGGRQAYVELIDPLERSAGGPDEGDGGVRAPMNGRVVALFVEEGATVEAGQRLAVVEAMKMEHALVAPFSGVVRDLVATVGEQVEMGERIMRVEAETTE